MIKSISRSKTSLIVLIGLCAHSVWGQRSILTIPTATDMVVNRDVSGRLITTFHTANKNGPTSDLVYLGSPFLTYPIWHAGTLIFGNKKQVPVQIAFNLVDDRVSLKLEDSSQVQSSEPVEFTVDQRHFVRLPTPGGRTFYQLLYAGKTRFLKQYRIQLVKSGVQGDSYNTSKTFNGEYKTNIEYYIQQGGHSPQPIRLNKKGLMKVFMENKSQLNMLSNSDQLTESDFIQLLQQHDSSQ